MGERGERRYLASVTPEDAIRGGRPLLWGYGVRWLLARAGVSVRTLQRARSEGLDPGEPIAAVAWLLEQRGRADLAEQVRETFRTDHSAGSDD